MATHANIRFMQGEDVIIPVVIEGEGTIAQDTFETVIDSLPVKTLGLGMVIENAEERLLHIFLMHAETVLMKGLYSFRTRRTTSGANVVVAYGRILVI